MTGAIVDLFAGPGGWSEGLNALGRREIGLEWDESACATARAAGHDRMQCDIAQVDFDSGWRGMNVEGLIASPPCQSYSTAGKGKGRAYLVASLDREVSLPAPTHTKYRKGKPKQEGDLLPWVSMAEALGWGMTARPSMTVTGGGSATGGAEPFGNMARQGMYREFGAGRWTPRQNARANATVRRADEPAPTITAGHDAGDRQWCFERPATAVCCDPRLSPPGYRGGPKDYDADGNYLGARSMDKAVRITPEEATVLMGFRRDYPWQGSKTKQFQQIGNAVCPPMGRAVLAAAMGISA